MEITGRVTKDAQVRKLRDNRELVAFTIVINDQYKTKAGEKKEQATFFNCSYWVSTKIAAILKKGSIVTLTGSVGINAYKTDDGKFHATLTFHCNYIKLIGGGSNTTTKPANTTAATGATDDLPF